MTQYLQYLVFAGAAVQLIGIAFYARGIFKGSTKPNKVTWLLWSAAPLIAAFAAFAKGVGLAAIPVFISGFGPLFIFFIALANKKSYWKLQKFDYFCGLFSILALVVWAQTKEPSAAIFFAILSDGFATVPTLFKAWKFPETESGGPYTAGLFNSLTAFFAVKKWSFAEIAFPAYLVIATSLLIISIYRKRIFKKKAH